ncbi:MAG: hypothetical protein M4D80_21550 [Myxococcota bacterium]|nr:hypothetical protein [Myxococcota bacterium]
MRALLFVVMFVGCGGEDSSKPPDATMAMLDAAVCATPADCPCFSNYDCPTTHTCKSMGSVVACVLGARGTGVPGTLCTGEQSCASALCVEDATGGMRCSDICHTAQTCPPELPRCIALGTDGICAREPPSQ